MSRLAVREYPSSSAAELDDLAAVAFGGATFRGRAEIAQGFAFFGELQPGFMAGGGFKVESLGHRGGAADGAEKQDFHFKFVRFSANVQEIADADLAGGLGGLLVALDPAQVAGARGDGARLEKAGSPEPLVDSQAGHGLIIVAQGRRNWGTFSWAVLTILGVKERAGSAPAPVR